MRLVATAVDREPSWRWTFQVLRGLKLDLRCSKKVELMVQLEFHSKWRPGNEMVFGLTSASEWFLRFIL